MKCYAQSELNNENVLFYVTLDTLFILNDFYFWLIELFVGLVLAKLSPFTYDRLLCSDLYPSKGAEMKH